MSMYSDSAKVETCLVTSSDGEVPYTVEKLVQYDEIILSNVDIRKINNVYAFIDAVDLVVSQYGKSLITLGNLYMQNKQSVKGMYGLAKYLRKLLKMRKHMQDWLLKPF